MASGDRLESEQWITQGTILLLVLFAVFYLIPTWIAFGREHAHSGGVFAVNLLLGLDRGRMGAGAVLGDTGEIGGADQSWPRKLSTGSKSSTRCCTRRRLSNVEGARSLIDHRVGRG